MDGNAAIVFIYPPFTTAVEWRCGPSAGGKANSAYRYTCMGSLCATGTDELMKDARAFYCTRDEFGSLALPVLVRRLSRCENV